MRASATDGFTRAGAVPRPAGSARGSRASSPTPAVDEVHGHAVEHDRRGTRRRQGDLADTVLGRRGGEEQAAVEPEDHEAGGSSAPGSSSSEEPRVRIPSQHRHPARGHRDSQINDSPTPSITPAGAGGPSPRWRHGDPEVEALHQAMRHLGHVHHAHDHSLDGQCRQHRLGRSNRGARKTRVGRTIAPEVKARPERAPVWSFNELADRLVETGIPWNSPEPMFAMP